MKFTLNPKGQAELFANENVARAMVEKLFWPDGPVCPHCGLVGNGYKLQGKSTRPGLYKCGGCRKPFTVTMRSIFEDSHLPLHKWLYAIHLICSSKKGLSAHQLHRMTETYYGKKISYRTAWFVFHRLRFAMSQHPLVDKLRGVVEADETWIGPKEKGTWRRGESKKRPVLSLVDRERGKVRSFPLERVTIANVRPIFQAHVEVGANLQTDEASVYHFVNDICPTHDSVNHSRKEYSRREDGRLITSNTVESFFSLVKRGIYGTYHHIGVPYLQQYLNEFDFRYNHRKVSDAEQAQIALQSTVGKRLMLKQPASRIN